MADLQAKNLKLQEENLKFQRKILLLEGNQGEIDQLSLDECSIYESTLKRTMQLILERKVREGFIATCLEV